MKKKNKISTDYTLSYLKFLSSFRATAPSARMYGLSPEEAARKRAEVDICLGRLTSEDSAGCCLRHLSPTENSIK